MLQCNWAVEQGLAGGMIWSLETDDFHGNCEGEKYPLLSKIYDIMKTGELTTGTTVHTTTQPPYTGPSTTISSTTVNPSTTVASIVPAEDRQVVCYYGSWAKYRPGDGLFVVSDIDPTICTHLVYAFAGLTNNEITMPDLPNDDTSFKELVALKNVNPNLKVTIAIGGWNEGSERFSTMVSTSTNRATFIQSVVAFIQAYNCDGLDLDWEYPTQRGGVPEDKENFAMLTAELKEVIYAGIFDFNKVLLNASSTYRDL